MRGGRTQDNTPMNTVPLMKDHEHGDSNQLDGEKKKVKAPGMVYFCKSL